MAKRSASPDIVAGPSIAPKRARALVAPRAPTLDSWLKPNEARPLLASSPALHAANSTFVSFTYAFVPPSHVRNVETLKKEARRVVRELDVVRLVGPELIARSEGCFADGGGRARGSAQRAREPDHRMWAVRALGLKEGKDGTGGEGDYQLLEASDDDGERYGGERILRVLQEQGGVDVLTICCRWFGGDMLGPSRFHHIGITSQHALAELQRLVELRDLRTHLVALDADIADLRAELAGGSAGSGGAGDGPTSSSLAPTATASQAASTTASQPRAQTYEDIEDKSRLERLLGAKEKTRANLQGRVGAKP